MKILCIVQARMGSERLAEKVIKPIMGKPMIIYILERLNMSKYITQTILATSIEEREKPLVDLVEAAGYTVFRGNERNVLKRYKETADKFAGDIIIRITGDCPFIDPIILDNVITYFKMNIYDYVRLDVPETFTRGFDVEMFTKEALYKAYNIVMNFDEKEQDSQFNMCMEHVTYYMYKHPEEFKIGFVKGSSLYNKGYRLCVDTKEDFQLVENIYNHFKDEFVSSKDIVDYLDKNPEVAKINKDIKQK